MKRLLPIAVVGLGLIVAQANASVTINLDASNLFVGGSGTALVPADTLVLLVVDTSGNGISTAALTTGISLAVGSSIGDDLIVARFDCSWGGDGYVSGYTTFGLSGSVTAGKPLGIIWLPGNTLTNNTLVMTTLGKYGSITLGASPNFGDPWAIPADGQAISLVMSSPDGDPEGYAVNVITASPTAGFSASPSNGVAPLTVTFTNTSVGPITNQFWQFGDGGTNSLVNPSHTYTNGGVFSVSLTVLGPYGIDTLTRTNLITVALVASATWTNGNSTGNWSTPSSWDSGVVPDFGSSVNFGVAGVTSVVDGVSRMVSNITFSGSGNFYVTSSGGAGLTINNAITVASSFAYTISAPVALGGANTWSVVGSGVLQVSGPISGANPITKTGSGTLILSGTNTYSGATVISNGTLKITGSGLITNTPSIDIASSATLDVSGRTNGSMTLVSGQTLKGKGTLQGNFVLANNSILSPGGSSVGTLTFLNDLVVSNTAVLQYDLGTNRDLTVVSSNLTLGGTLNVNNAGGFTTGVYTLVTYGGVLTYKGVTVGSVPSGYACVIDTNTAGQVRLNVVPASTLVVAAADLQDRLGNLMPASGVVVLVVDTGTNGFVDPPPASPLYLGATWGADDQVVGLWNLNNCCGDGFLYDQTVVGYTSGITSGQKLQLYWFPSLTLASNTVGATYYGKYTDQVGIDNSAVWKTPAGGSYTELDFWTQDEGGSNPQTAGRATLFTAPPVANFIAVPTSGAAPLPVTLTDTSTGSITNRFWSFGDGNTTNTTATSISHTYNAGTYAVSLTVSGPQGSDTLTRSNYIATGSGVCFSAPAGMVSWWPGDGAPDDVQGGNTGKLTNNVTYVTGVVGSAFQFGGSNDAVVVGNPANLHLQSFTIDAWVKRADATHISLNPGDGEIFCYGANGYGFGLRQNGTACRLFLTRVGLNDVTSGSLQVTDLNYHHVAVTKSNSAVIFYVDGVATSAQNYDPGFTFTTSAALGARGDNLGSSILGNLDEVEIFNRALSAAEIQGIFNAGAAGKCKAPVASFTGTPTNGWAPLMVAFADTSTGSIANRLWDFGDGNTTNTTATSVNHTYNAGTYTVSLTVSGFDGGSSTNTRANYIVAVIPPPPVAAFNASPSNGVAPLAVTFIDSSTGATTNRFWDFGDGATSNTMATTVQHTYIAAGTNTVTLVVSGPGGVSASTQSNCIIVSQCIYSIAPASASYGVGTTNGSVSVTAGSGCAWIATNNVGWITITSGGSGTGSGTVGYSVASNFDCAARMGTVTAAGLTHTVIQAGNYSISPTNAFYDANVHNGNVSVTAGSGCSWTASVSIGSTNWIKIFSGSSGTGSGSVNYSIPANSGTDARTGSVAIAGFSHTVIQAGAGDTNSWINPGSYYWEDPTSWSLGLAPSGDQGAVLITNANSKIVLLDILTSYATNFLTINNLNVWASLGATNTMIVNMGTLTAPLHILNSLVVRSGGSLLVNDSILQVDGISGGSFSLDGAMQMDSGAVITTGAVMAIGNLGVGTATVNGGYLLASDLSVGKMSGSRGSMTIAGGSVSVANHFLIGDNGTGSVLVSDGQLVATNNLTAVGFLGVGQMTISNGTARFGDLGVGSYGQGTLTVLSGQLMAGTNFTMVGDTGKGQLTVSGGTATLNCSVFVGIDKGTGAVLVAGGQLAVTGSNTFIGCSGIGEMTVSNGAVLANALYVGSDLFGFSASNTTGGAAIGNVTAGISRGTLTMAGGTVTLNSSLVVGTDLGSTGAVWVTGGRLTATNDSTVIGYAGTAQLTVSNGTAMARDVTVGQLGGSVGTLTIAGGSVMISSNLVLGDCATNAVGNLVLNSGTLYITNATHSAVLDVRNGLLMVNGGLLVLDRLVMTNACAHFVRTGGTLIYSEAVLDPARDDDGDDLPNGWEQAYGLDPLSSSGNNGHNGDPDGDGFTNWQEYLYGTDPTNSASAFRIIAIGREGNDVRVTWNCASGHSYVLQSTRSAAIATYTTNFADASPVIVGSEVGEPTTNYLDVGAAYAAVLTAPGGQIPTNAGAPSTVDISAAGTRGLADSLGGAIHEGSLLMLGTFSISESTIQSNFNAGNLSAIMSAFTPYSTSFAVGDGTGLPASWDVSLSAAGFAGQQIYLLAVDKPTLATATHLGIFTAPSWVFPEDAGEISIDLEDVTDFVIGTPGGPLTINLGLGQSYTFDDTARLSYLPGRILFYRVKLVQQP